MRHLERSGARSRELMTVLPVVGLALVIGLILLVASRHGSGDGSASPAASTTTSAPTASSSASTAPSTTPTLVPRTPTGPLVAGKATCVQDDTTTPITVVDWNIKSGHGGGTLAQIATAIHDAGADIVLLQETDVHRPSTGNVDMPAYFGAALGMYHAFGENVAHGAGGYGTTVLSRFPIVSVLNTHLPRPGHTQQRGLLHVVVDVHGTELSIYDTHLQNLDQPARIAQMHTILGLVAQDPRPQILGGDFNSQPNSPPSVLARTHFTDTWAAVGTGTGRTHPANHLRGRIDYLMNANTGITPVSSDVLPEKLSDHMGVRASYVVAGPPTKTCVQELVPGPVLPHLHVTKAHRTKPAARG